MNYIIYKYFINKFHISVIQLKGETNILYRLISCKVSYFKPLCVIFVIMDYRYEPFHNILILNGVFKL